MVIIIGVMIDQETEGGGCSSGVPQHFILEITTAEEKQSWEERDMMLSHIGVYLRSHKVRNSLHGPRCNITACNLDFG